MLNDDDSESWKGYGVIKISFSKEIYILISLTNSKY